MYHVWYMYICVGGNMLITRKAKKTGINFGYKFSIEDILPLVTLVTVQTP